MLDISGSAFYILRPGELFPEKAPLGLYSTLCNILGYSDMEISIMKLFMIAVNSGYTLIAVSGSKESGIDIKIYPAKVMNLDGIDGINTLVNEVQQDYEADLTIYVYSLVAGKVAKDIYTDTEALEDKLRQRIEDK